ncbi:PD40 domain-containing protein [Pleionea sediminis]|uniref:HzsA-related protein n=1 Tax=Pleionea sediminis TaxID=2569479 RepID=UPI0011864245|nr:PD40 domain-containing protein [Pleionea sediminis]
MQPMLRKSKFLTLPTFLLSALIIAGCTSDDPIADSSQDPDPTVSDFAVAFVARPIPADEDGNPIMDNVNEPEAFNPGAVLMLKDRALPSAQARDISTRAFIDPENPDVTPLYDVKDLSVSPDGLKLVFAMRAPEDPNLDEEDQPKWNIWQYELETDTLTRVIASNIVAEDGHDVMPTYLPDGRIAFASTRQRQAKAILLDEGKPQFSGLEEGLDTHAFVLHVMSDDGSNLKQITFNQSHDFNPTLLEDGRLAFLRLDQMGGSNAHSLYTVHPDGTNLQRLYGYHSQNTGNGGVEAVFSDPQIMPDGRLLVLSKPVRSITYGGDPVTIDFENFIEADQRTDGTEGQGQESIAADVVNTDNTPSPGGLFHSISPLWDDSGGRIIMSWSPCLLREFDATTEESTILPCTDENIQSFEDGDLLPATPSYGIWIWNRSENTQTPVVVAQDGMWMTEPVIFQERFNSLSNIPDGVPGIDLDQDLVSDNVGVLHIRSVYDIDGVDSTPNGIAQLADPAITPPGENPDDFQRARFLRIVKGVAIPDDEVYDFDRSAFGRAGNQLMREILGYVPIEPDGSVKVKIPANVPFTISLLDEYGQRVSGRHENWLQLRLGEERECTGCHTSNSELSHGRADADPVSAYSGSLGNSNFPNSNPAIFADDGETMAEAYTRINGVPEPSLDVQFTDVWTDPNVVAPAEDINYLYSDLLTPAPISDACASSWYAGCRITIHYEEHIQPIFDLPRQVVDDMGDVVEDNTCTNCHSLVNPEDNMPQVPAGQLELTSLPSTDEPLHMRGFRELLFQDDQVELVGGAIIDRQVPVQIDGSFLYQTIDPDGLIVFFLDADGMFIFEQDPDTQLPTVLSDTDGSPIFQTDAQGQPVFETDENGEIVLDNNGDPIPLTILLPVPEPAPVTDTIAVDGSPILRSAGSTASERFFELFRTGSHQGRLSDAELRLIAEWLDIGGQYFNNPFLAPEN